MNDLAGMLAVTVMAVRVETPGPAERQQGADYPHGRWFLELPTGGRNHCRGVASEQRSVVRHGIWVG